jgi:hypothetical protein
LAAFPGYTPAGRAPFDCLLAALDIIVLRNEVMWIEGSNCDT